MRKATRSSRQTEAPLLGTGILSPPATTIGRASRAGTCSAMICRQRIQMGAHHRMLVELRMEAVKELAGGGGRGRLLVSEWRSESTRNGV